MTADVRRVEDNEFFTWLDLYAGYGEFYETPVTDEQALLVSLLQLFEPLPEFLEPRIVLAVSKAPRDLDLDLLRRRFAIGGLGDLQGQHALGVAGRDAVGLGVGR